MLSYRYNRCLSLIAVGCANRLAIFAPNQQQSMKLYSICLLFALLNLTATAAFGNLNYPHPADSTLRPGPAPNGASSSQRISSVPAPAADKPVEILELSDGSDYTLVYVSKDVRMLTISIRNTDGKLMRHLQISGRRHLSRVPLDMVDYPPGDYTVNVDANGSRYAFPLTRR